MNYNNYKLIIVIGLPGSGKTTYCKKYIKTHILYDDFIPFFYNGNIINNLLSKKNIVVNDPRLCNFNTFKLYMEIFEKYVVKKDILLVLFENEKDKCLKNIMIESKKDSEIYNSKFYNTKKYNKYNNIIIPVYSK